MFGSLSFAFNYTPAAIPPGSKEQNEWSTALACIIFDL